MTPERWVQVEEIFEAALAQPPEERKRFVSDACRGDSDLKLEVASLLASHEQAGSFLEAPPASRSGIVEGTPTPVGLTFLPDQIAADRFKVLRFLAEGGMGEVYEAFDQELREKVALKTIRLTMIDEEEAESRFMREIQLARRVTHPNVCRIYDVFHHKVESGNSEAEVRFLTMELLSGESLGKRLRSTGPMSAARALPIAEQIASALAAAHDVGIVHRDLKPDNVMLVRRKKGLRAVVMDFGLARGDETQNPEPVVAMATSREDLLWTLHGMQAGGGQEKPGALRRLARRARRQLAAFGLVARVNEPLTQQGRVMGTPAYMSPEQARGAKADERSDIWSFGVLVYEMLTGDLPYRRETSWARFVRRLSGKKPSAGKLRNIPNALQAVVRRCLELERSERYGDFDELLRDLRRVQQVAEPSSATNMRVGALAIASAVLLLAAWYFISIN